MLNFILKNLESFPSASFTESELVRISRPSFISLTTQKYLERLKYDYMKEPYYSSALGDNGNERQIKKVGGRLYAYSVESADSAPIEVTEADLRRYQLSFPALFAKIRQVNKIEGKFQEIEGYFYIGYKLYDSFRVGFIFVPKIGDGKLVKFAGLQNLCKDDKVLVVFTPFTKIEDIVLNWTLSKCKIVTTPLAGLLDFKTFKLPVEDLVAKIVDRKKDFAKALSRLALSKVDREICICAAIKLNNGEVYRGHRHGDCILGINRQYKDKTNWGGHIQGFITSTNRFVCREEGRKLQDAAGIKSAEPEGYRGKTLFSEDLY